jgi:anti-sigma factor RsiW
MSRGDSHISDEELLLALEGELPARKAKRVHGHLQACWNCRVRRQDLERAITDFVGVHREQMELPPAAGPRALLRARLVQVSAGGHRPRFEWRRVLGLTGAVSAVLALGFAIAHLPTASQAAVLSMPDSRLTPGATVLVSRPAVCSQPGAGNKEVPTALRRRVFQEYGISKADPRAYEVDYLVTPALGGADDIHNLWPHSHSAVWNARVKDALEDRLREMVCAGNLDLGEAQQEIATDWISAYKKYFHTDEPLPEHRR